MIKELYVFTEDELSDNEVKLKILAGNNESYRTKVGHKDLEELVSKMRR